MRITNSFFFFFLADVYHMWSSAWRISMSQEYPTPIPFETFLCGSMKWCILNKCHDGLAEVLVFRQSDWNYLLWASLVFTYLLYHPPLSGIRSWFSFGNLLSLGHVVLVRWPQCPTSSELIRIFSKICFSKIYSC